MNDLSITPTLDRSEGRNCPLSYRYTPEAIARLRPWTAEVVYVVGGLYGNTFALEALEALAAREVDPVRIVFNGDFNWFNIDDTDFISINAGVLEHLALRGNVETELSLATAGAGCGCSYPDWIDDATVHRSNQIMTRLYDTAVRHADLQARLRDLHMYTTAQVGDLSIAIVHGDAHSLAGWDFARERQDDETTTAPLQDDFLRAGVQVFASSHTCTPVFRRLQLGADHGEAVLINNGAAGMPNFADRPCGIITRIALRPAPVAPLYGHRLSGVHIDALALEYDQRGFERRFLAQWPAGSPAHRSYFQRIAGGPAGCR